MLKVKWTDMLERKQLDLKMILFSGGKRIKNIFPVMCHLAKKYLCMQATSTTAEHAMSLLGNIVSKKRCQLSDEHVNMLEF